MTENKRIIFTLFAVSLVGTATGLFFHGALLPTQAAGLQRYDNKNAEKANEIRIVHGHDTIAQHEHMVTVTTTVMETTPHGDSHGFAEKLAPWVFKSGSAATQGAYEIWIYGREFMPNTLTVPAGTKVTWINKSPEQHTVTSNGSLFNSLVYIKGSISDSSSYTFTEPGTYNFYCQPHSGMTGKIIVTASATKP